MLLNQLFRHAPISKAELAEITGLSFMSVSNIISELERENLIEEKGIGSSKGGRKPTLYQLHTRAHGMLCVDISVEEVNAAVVDFTGSIIKRATSGYQQTADGLLETLYELLDALFISESDNIAIHGIGVSSPGPIDKKNGKILSPPNLEKVQNVAVVEALQDWFQLPTLLEKDANAALFGEYWFGKSIGHNNIFYVLADQGIGGALLFQKKLVQGFLSGAGEIGHHVIDVNGPKCSCGNHGCLETFASGIAIVDKARQAFEKNKNNSFPELTSSEQINFPYLIRAAVKGNILATQLLEGAANFLGTGIANMVNLFNPDEIIVGGSYIHGYPKALETIRYIVKEQSLFDKEGKTGLRISEFTEYSQLIGAGAVVMEYIFENPERLLT
ncbi:ROK family transcriptional regulator [Sediminibacillus massiliensis]|uniref:ROK family transcriptional regulator n=1 Tax=Sediminibacillus massiliensis TaxID=1926277 RepID=UPI0009885094|nr:ROK family transcriptional regulator [Sediminibacillus massiliensis]